jgi:hypothetical protein
MMSPSTIQRLSDEHARKAAVQRRVPYVPFDEKEVDTFGVNGMVFPFPNLGSYRPRGWELVEDLFCDGTGWGSEHEPAMTPRQLREKIKSIISKDAKTYGFAIIECGQFQLYIGVFERTPEADEPLPPPSRSDRIAALEYAVREEHPCSDTQGCDIAFALNNDFILWAAHLLMDATECPLTEEAWNDLLQTDTEFCQSLREANEEATEMADMPHRTCVACDSVNWGSEEEMSDRCENCHVKWSDGEKNDQSPDDDDCAGDDSGGNDVGGKEN